MNRIRQTPVQVDSKCNEQARLGTKQPVNQPSDFIGYNSTWHYCGECQKLFLCWNNFEVTMKSTRQWLDKESVCE
jgi:hypothetical protein